MASNKKITGHNKKYRIGQETRRKQKGNKMLTYFKLILSSRPVITYYFLIFIYDFIQTIKK